METKKLGFLVMGISILFGFVMFSYMGQLNAQGQQMLCNPTQECRQVNSMLGWSHAVVGFLSFIFSLGFYLLFFNKNEKELLKDANLIEKNNINNNYNANYNNFEKNNETSEKMNSIDKFSLLLRPLDDNERKVLTSIKEQEGITQSTLRFRANLSKSKISQILTDFEKKNLIERKAKGKTYQVFLTDNYGN
ncbi:MAG: MarR family transcriptional regulator [Nanoarchaeota archaeon]